MVIAYDYATVASIIPALTKCIFSRTQTAYICLLKLYKKYIENNSSLYHSHQTKTYVYHTIPNHPLTTIAYYEHCIQGYFCNLCSFKMNTILSRSLMIFLCRYVYMYMRYIGNNACFAYDRARLLHFVLQYTNTQEYQMQPC